MRNLKVWPVLVFAFALAANVFAQKVETDYDHSANFSQFKTFMWVKPPKMDDQIQAKRIVDAVNAQLTAKGLQLVQSGGDLAIASHVATQQEHTLNTFYNGFGGGWRWGGWPGGTATTTVDTYTVGTLVVDLFDTHPKQLVWRGTATDTVSDKPEKNAEKINKAAEKMFEKFPPKERG
jgi:hypothetical protein